MTLKCVKITLNCCNSSNWGLPFGIGSGSGS